MKEQRSGPDVLAETRPLETIATSGSDEDERTQTLRSLTALEIAQMLKDES